MSQTIHQEKILTQDDIFELGGVKKLFLHNQSNEVVTIGIYEIPGNGKHTIETTANCFSKKDLNISFKGTQKKLYMEIHKIKGNSCNCKKT